MSPHESEPLRIVRFGLYEVDLKSKELRRSGMKVKLTAQPFQVLVVLLQNAGDIVTREELRKQLWPQDTFVDFEHGLNAAIKRLRDALGETAESPVFIETFPRQGYRFIGRIDSPTKSPVRTEVTKWNTRIRFRLAVGAVGCLLLVIVFWGLFTKRPGAQMVVFPLVTYPGEKYLPSLSPDGQRIAFSWNGGSGTAFSLYEKVVDSEKSLRLTNVPEAVDFGAVWSPDGHEIAFARILNGGTGIYSVPALGGPERKLVQLVWVSPKSLDVFSVTPLDWSSDGKSIIYSDSPENGKAQALMLLSLDSMHISQLTSPVYQTGDINPKFSPDGQMVAFVRDTTGGQSICVIPVSGGHERVVTSEIGLKAGLAWTADGHNLVFGGRWLWKISVAGGQAERLPVGQDGYQPSIRDNRMVYIQASWSDSVWRRSIDSKDTHEPAQKLISSTRADAGPQFSPNGESIAFQSDRSGVFEIWRCNKDGTDPKQLTHFGVPWTGTPRWSPDGRFIVFDSRVSADADLYVIDAQGGPPQRITTDPSNEVVPSWSKDGRWIYFASDRSGRWEVWKVPPTGGKAVQLTHRGGFGAFESADGKFLYYAKGLNAPGLWEVPLDGGKESEILGMPAVGFWGYWAPVRDGIYYLDSSGKPAINFLNLSTHKTNLAFYLENRPVESAPAVTVSPDGKSILYTQVNQSIIDVALIQNIK